MSTQFKADYKAMVGDAKLNKLASNAGLGVTGAYLPFTYTLAWAPGEIVDLARAEKLTTVLKQGINEDPALDCCKVDLLRVYTAEVEDPIENGK